MAIADPLLDILADWKTFRCAVIGDFMLDQHFYGDAERLSADAPVPILLVREQDERPGGAANVCLDLIALGATVEAVGVVGEDVFAPALRSRLMESGVGIRGIVVDAARPTTVKQNLVGRAQARHPQKMFRVDFESSEPLAAAIEQRLIAAAIQAIASADVVCIEDYGKGVCTDAVCRAVIDACRVKGVPVFVDPGRGRDYSIYRGASAITPNRTEAEEATNVPTAPSGDAAHNAQLAQALMKTCDLEAVILTLDRHGALVLERGTAPVSVPTVARQVYDVTGAGDMFLAALAAARVNGASWVDSTRFANAAAGLEVEVFGVQPIPFAQIHHAILVQREPDRTGARELADVLVEVRARRAQGQKVVFTNGCFDVLHTGHVWLLSEAKSKGDFLVVGMNSDASVRRLKGPSRPINTQADRARVLSALAGVGAVVIFDDDTPLSLIEKIEPDVLVKGADYTKDKVVGAELVERRGGRVELVSLVEGKSTTKTVEKAMGERR